MLNGNGNGTLTKARDGVQHLGVHASRAAHAVEDTAARVPPDTFLALAIGSIGVSLYLAVTGKKQSANFVGQWVPTFIALGLYNKIARAQRDMDY